MTPEEVRKIAKLARLSLSDAQVAAFGPQMSAILRHMDTLRTLDLKGVEPLTHIGDSVNRLAADAPGPTLSTEILMDMAPDKDSPFVKVPKVLGEGGGA
jgi:aspartyl-tRNA(Asn)/glutamyl-tRNA(Gln) amidotransferase subunit C